MSKPTILQLLQAEGYDTFTPQLIQQAIKVLYSDVGAGLDNRDWDTILKSSDPLATASQSLTDLYKDPTYLLENAQHLASKGYSAVQIEITYRQMQDRLDGFSYINKDWANGTSFENATTLSDSELKAQATQDATPGAPVVNAVSTDNLINATEHTSGFTLTGTGKVGATVTISGFASDKTALVQSNGTWSISVATSDLPNDSQTNLSATQTSGGLTSGVTSFTITTDDTAPVITTGPVVASVANISMISNENGQAGIYDSGNLIGSTVSLTANNVGTIGVSAQSSITTADLVVTDTAGNTTTSNVKVVLGTTGDDSLSGTTGDDLIFGFDGADTITGNTGNDTFTGGAGNDTFNVDAGIDTITDLSGSDILKVSSGATANATVSADFTATSATQNLGGAATNATLTADAGIDIDMTNASVTTATTDGFVINGSIGDEILKGSAGNDTIDGDAGADTIAGGAGADTIDAGAGDDTLVVIGTFDNTGGTPDYTVGDVTANTGAFWLGLKSYIESSSTNNTTSDSGTNGTGEIYNGGDGDDTIEIWGNANLSSATVSNIEHTNVHSDLTMSASQLLALGQSISGGNFDINMLDQDSQFTISGISSMGSTEITNLLGALDNTDFYIDSTLIASAISSGANLTIQTESMGGTNYELMGVVDSDNNGSDDAFFNGILSAQDSGSGVTVDYSGYASGQNLFVLGSTHDDNITATNNGDLIVETAGTNSITGGTGNDIIVTTNGTNTITGGAGVDTLILGAGDDRVVFSAVATNGNDIIRGFTGGTGTSDVLNVSGLATLTGSGSLIATSATTSATTVVTNSAYIVTDDAAADWSDVLTVLGGAIDESGAGCEKAVFIIDNGTDARVYLYQNDTTDNTFQAAELTQVATLTGVDTSTLAADDLAVS